MEKKSSYTVKICLHPKFDQDRSARLGCRSGCRRPTDKHHSKKILFGLRVILNYYFQSKLKSPFHPQHNFPNYLLREIKKPTLFTNK